MPAYWGAVDRKTKLRRLAERTVLNPTDSELFQAIAYPVDNE